MVKTVVRGSRDKTVVDAAVKYCNNLLVTFRCEERRKVSLPHYELHSIWVMYIVAPLSNW